jgi:hypothetical protein
MFSVKFNILHYRVPDCESARAAGRRIVIDRKQLAGHCGLG